MPQLTRQRNTENCLTQNDKGLIKCLTFEDIKREMFFQSWTDSSLSGKFIFPHVQKVLPLFQPPQHIKQEYRHNTSSQYQIKWSQNEGPIPPQRLRPGAGESALYYRTDVPWTAGYGAMTTAFGVWGPEFEFVVVLAYWVFIGYRKIGNSPTSPGPPFPHL